MPFRIREKVRSGNDVERVDRFGSQYAVERENEEPVLALCQYRL